MTVFTAAGVHMHTSYTKKNTKKREKHSLLGLCMKVLGGLRSRLHFLFTIFSCKNLVCVCGVCEVSGVN